MEPGAKTAAPFVVIVGCGLVGAHLATLLDGEGCAVRLVDSDAARCAALPERLAGACFVGEPLKLSVLQRAGIEEADVLVAAMPEDDLNLAIALVCRKAFGIRQVIACVQDPVRADWYRRFDLPVVCQTTLVASQLLQIIQGSVPA
jgi:trk system potassium uptake protein TrkA